MKGGYQTIDLSTADTSGAVEIEGALEAFKNSNGKPVLIKTPSGNSVFAKVNEGELGTFTASYIDGEDIVTVTIDSLSQVLLEVLGTIDTGNLDERIDTVEERVNANKYVDRISILPYNTTENKFTAPSDGYLWVRSIAGKLIDVAIELAGQGSDPMVMPVSIQGTTASSDNSVFIKKGVKLYIRSSNDDNNIAYFYPLGN